jgi:hypothetical protein
VDGQHHVPAVLPLGKTRYPLYRRLGGPQGRSGRLRKISPLPGFFFSTPGPSSPQSVAIPTELPGPRSIIIKQNGEIELYNGGERTALLQLVW